MFTFICRVFYILRIPGIKFYSLKGFCFILRDLKKITLPKLLKRFFEFYTTNHQSFIMDSKKCSEINKMQHNS